MKVVQVPKLLVLLANCWGDAERALQHQLRDATNSDEDFITKLFHLELSKNLREASERNLVSSAFFKDLQLGLAELDKQILAKIASGLIADVTLHKPEKEKLTGGDLGVLFLRPLVSFDGSMLTIEDYRRGLLCQAKIKRRNGKWGGFTAKQRTVLPFRLSYLGLLLYKYNDQARRELGPFSWQLCSGLSFEEVEKCLKLDTFPSLTDSTTIIQKLGRASIGTDDEKTIDAVISTAKNPCLTIKIDWRSGKKPPRRSRLHLTPTHTQHQAIKIRH